MPCVSASQTNLQICNPLLLGNSIFQATDEITVANCGGKVEVSSTGDITMKAGQDIILYPGFSTKSGAVFTAQIQMTSPCQTTGIVSYKTNNSEAWTSDSSIVKKSMNGIKVYAYPNPAIDIITVGALNNYYHDISFTVRDITGRFIMRYDTPSISSGDVRQTIDVASYAAGIYVVTMEADNQKYSFKFAKE